MINPKIWLSSPHMGGNEQKYVQEAFDTNWVAPLGPNVNGLEIDLEKYIGNQSHSGALSSGTAAIHLGLILLGVKAGDEVICQSMTFSASANPILYLGATPVFIDSEIDTWNLCPIALEKAIIDRIEKGKKPKAHIYFLQGLPCYSLDNMQPLDKTKQAIDKMVELGYAVYFMEKGDMGDNQNCPPCLTMGFNEELAMYDAGYQNLLNLSSVNKDKIVRPRR